MSICIALYGLLKSSNLVTKSWVLVKNLKEHKNLCVNYVQKKVLVLVVIRQSAVKNSISNAYLINKDKIKIKIKARLILKDLLRTYIVKNIQTI